MKEQNDFNEKHTYFEEKKLFLNIYYLIANYDDFMDR